MFELKAIINQPFAMQINLTSIFLCLILSYRIYLQKGNMTFFHGRGACVVQSRYKHDTIIKFLQMKTKHQYMKFSPTVGCHVTVNIPFIANIRVNGVTTFFLAGSFL